MADDITPAAAPEAVVPSQEASTASPSVAVDASPVDTPKVESAPEQKSEPSTVLGAEPKEEIKKDEKTEVKADESADKSVEQPKEEGKQSDEPAPLPTYEDFSLPEGLEVDNEKLGEFTKELANFEIKSKADHALMQELGQNLVNRHIAEVQNTIERVNKHYLDTWEKQKNDWKEAFVKDPEIGGNRQETTVKAALEFIRTHGGNEAQQQEFRQLMEQTGIGNHPAMIRLLAKANSAMREGKPLPASKPSPQSTSKIAKRYGDT